MKIYSLLIFLYFIDLSIVNYNILVFRFNRYIGKIGVNIYVVEVSLVEERIYIVSVYELFEDRVRIFSFVDN